MTGAPRKTFNKYKILEDYAIIYLQNKNHETLECLVDTEDINKLIELNKHWHTIYDKVLEHYYVATNVGFYDNNGKYKQTTIYIHKFLLNYKGNGKYIDHKNHDTLDNRNNNLIVVSQKLNSKNRLEANKNNVSGYRNVSFAQGKWLVQLQIDGKNKVLGKFKTPEEANDFAIEMREKYYKPLLKYIDSLPITE
jgi:hypothetical protein